MRTALLILVTVALVGCTSTPQSQVARVSDALWPEAVVKAPKAEVRDRLVATMVDDGAIIDSVNDSLIQARYRDTNAEFKRAQLYCGSCAKPYISVSIVLSNAESGTRVLAQYWQVTPKLNGTEARETVQRNEDYNRWQGMLWRLRDEYAKN